MKVTGLASVVLFLAVLPGVAESAEASGFTQRLGAGSQFAALGVPGHVIEPAPIAKSDPDIAPEWQFAGFALHAAALADDATRIGDLVRLGYDVDQRDRYGKTPLMVAAAFGNRAAANALLDLGAGLAVADTATGARALHYAARAGHVGIDSATLLIARGAAVNAGARRGETALHAAAAFGHLGMIALLAAEGADLDAKDGDGLRPLQYARRLGRLPAVAALLRLGSLEDGIHEAVDAGDLARVRQLLRQGVPADEPGLDGTPLHRAAARGHIAIAAALLDAGADIDAVGDPVGAHPLHVAAIANQPALAAFLIERGANLESRDAEGRTPLMAAAAFSSTTVGALLILASADIRAVDDKEMAPVHHAAASGDADLLSLLLSRGVAVDTPNHRTGMTPLHYAASIGHLSVIRLLANHGARPRLRDRTGSTSFYHAIRCGTGQALELLREIERQ